MLVYEKGNMNAPVVLVEMIDHRDSSSLDTRIELIRRNTAVPFRFIFFSVDDWLKELSPWKIPPVFRNCEFGDGAEKTLEEVLSYISGKGEKYVIGGYSLSSLFAVWASFEAGIFSSVAAASPSIWFPGFTDYMRTHSPYAESVYLSLGKKEADTKNPVMKNVSSAIVEAEEILKGKGVKTTLVWNEGGHFKDPVKRTADAFSYALDSLN